MPRKTRLLTLCFLLWAGSGCTFFQYLSPSQIWKINRYPASKDPEGQFSIPAADAEAEASGMNSVTKSDHD